MKRYYNASLIQQLSRVYLNYTSYCNTQRECALGNIGPTKQHFQKIAVVFRSFSGYIVLLRIKSIELNQINIQWNGCFIMGSLLLRASYKEHIAKAI